MIKKTFWIADQSRGFSEVAAGQIHHRFINSLHVLFGQHNKCLLEGQIPEVYGVRQLIPKSL